MAPNTGSVGAPALWNRSKRLGVLCLAAAAQIIFAGRRISTDHDKLLSLGDKLMPCARRQDHHVADADLDLLTLLPPKRTLARPRAMPIAS